MRRLGCGMLLLLGGCWVTPGEVRAKFDEPTGTQPGTPAGAPTGTPPGLVTSTPTGTTDTLIGCADEAIGSAVGRAHAGTTSGMGDDFSSECGFPTTGNDVVLQWTAPNTSCFTFDTEGSTYDTAIALYEADCDGDPEVCNDDRNDEQTISEVGYEVTGGVVYLIVVDGPDAGDNGSYELNIRPSDAFEVNGDLGQNTGTYSSTTAGADDTLSPAACPYASGADVLLSWTAPSSKTWSFALDPFNTDFDSVLSVHRPCISDAVVCDDYYNTFAPNGGELIELTLTAGESIILRVGGFQGASGDFALQVF